MTAPRPAHPRSSTRPARSGGALIAVAVLLAALVSLAPPASATGRPVGPGGPAGPAVPAAPAAPPAPAGWRLVWRDDFTGPADSPVDTTAWLHDLGHCYTGCPAADWGTGEVPEMTDSVRNVGLDGDGHLLITPLRDPVDPARWTSGRIETRRSDFAAPAGGALRVEVRLGLPAAPGPTEAQGYRTGFWMLGAPFRAGYHDPTGAGDVDVIENVNDHPEIIGAVHCSPPGGDPCHEIPDNVGLFGTSTCPPAGCRVGLHTYAVEIHRESSPQRIDWLVDGVRYHTVRADDPGMDDATWQLLVDRGFFLILSQSIGGSWPGGPTTTTRSGVPLVVDHVAVFDLRPGTDGDHHHPKGDGDGDHTTKGDHHSSGDDDHHSSGDDGHHTKGNGDHTTKDDHPKGDHHSKDDGDHSSTDDHHSSTGAGHGPDRHDEHEPCRTPAKDHTPRKIT